MSDFFETVKSKIDEGISSITSKSKNALELTQLRSQLRQVEKERTEKIITLGNIVCDMLRRGVFVEQTLRDNYLPIKAFDNRIIEIEGQIIKIEGADLTENMLAFRCSCGASIKEEQKFCASCGKAVVEKKEEVPAEKILCGDCGFQLKAIAKFCSKCGAKQ